MILLDSGLRRNDREGAGIEGIEIATHTTCTRNDKIAGMTRGGREGHNRRDTSRNVQGTNRRVR